MRHSEFMKDSAKNNVLRVITSITIPISIQQTFTLAKKVSKESYTNLKYIEKRLTIHYNNK